MERGEQVLKTLLYFEIFSYPLTACELLKFLKIKLSPVQLNECLDDLVRKKCIFRFGDFYSLHSDQKNINRRIKGNLEAAKWLKVARRQAMLIAKFPYVRAVMASGSLSKGYMDEKSDLDFFIVTAPKRLWIARTLLVLYKRIFLLNSHKHFCVNYFVDLEHLEIEEKNIFTATEVVTLVPLYNPGCYDTLLNANAWVHRLFPNFKHILTQAGGGPSDRHFFKRVLEIILTPVSHWMDKFFMRISLRRWHQIYGGQYTKEDFDIAFKTRRHVSKNHPNHYQKQVLERYQSKLADFQQRFADLTPYE